MNYITLIIYSLITVSTFAEKQEILYPAELISKSLSQQIDLYRTDETYTGQGGLKNYYARFIVPTGTITTPLLLITGAEDPTPLWYRTVGKAIEQGFKNIYIIEIRGQGLSERVAGNDKKLIHVNDFQNYYKDFISALKHINRYKTLNAPVYVISHSTGSMVLLNSLEKAKKEIPEFKINAMSFWAPLIRVHLSKLLDNTMAPKLVSSIEKMYRSCCGPFVYKKFKRSSFEKNKLTGNISKFNIYQDLMYKHSHGSTGFSLAWVIGVLSELRYLRSGVIKTHSIPTLNLKAEFDRVVNNDYKFSNKNLETHTIKGSKHSFNLESDLIYNNVIKKTFGFLLSH